MFLLSLFIMIVSFFGSSSVKSHVLSSMDLWSMFNADGIPSIHFMSLLNLTRMVTGLSKSNANWRTRWMHEGGGTRRYMSPEQLSKKNARLDARSDIFSFGLTMYELFCGRHPCKGDTGDIQKQIKSTRYRFSPPSKYNSQISSALDRIILKAIRRKLDKRYQSATEMLMDLSRIGQSRI